MRSKRLFIQMSPLATAPAYSCLIDAERGEKGTLYVEGNKTLISLNLSRKSRALISQLFTSC